MRMRIRPYCCAWFVVVVVSTVVLFLPLHHSSRGIGIKCSVAPVSRMIGIRLPPAVFLVRDGGYGRMNTVLVVACGRVCVRVRVR